MSSPDDGRAFSRSNALGRFGLPALLLSFFALEADAAPAFTNSTQLWGLQREMTLSWGASFVDFNGDGLEDLYVCNHWRSLPNLYRNPGSPPLLENSAHFVGLPLDRHDQLWADLDNNGVPDHFILHGETQPYELFWNQGDGTFLEGATAAGVDGLVAPGVYSRGRECTMADFDKDGALDIYVVNALRSGYPAPSAFYWNDGDGTFTRQQPFPLNIAKPHCSSGDYNGDGFFDIIVTNPFDQNGVLYRNNGNRTWTSVTASAFPGIPLPLWNTQGISWADYDDDGDLDLLAVGGDGAVWDYAAIEADSARFQIVNGLSETKLVHLVTTGDSVTVFCQRHTFQFLRCYFGSSGEWTETFPATLSISQIAGVPPNYGEDVPALFLWSNSAGPADSVHFAVKSSSTISLNAGGWMRTPGGAILSLTSQGFDAPPPQATADLSDRLYRNEGNGTFTDVTSTAFPANDPDANGFGAAWGDYDNDGRIDVYIANGGTIETGNQPDHLYRNLGNDTFIDVAAIEGVQGSSPGITEGGTWGDINGDGFLDLFVNNGRESPPFGHGLREFYTNTPNGNHWIALHLRGIESNGSGIGARVRVVGPTGTRRRTLLGDSDSAYSNFLGIHVGLGSDTTCNLVEIVWPSGQVDQHFNIGADQRYLAIEGESLRPFGNPIFAINPSGVTDTLGTAQNGVYPLEMQAAGAEAIQYFAQAEDLDGNPISWLICSEPSGVVWPGAAVTQHAVVLTSSLSPGVHIGRLVFSSNDVIGDDPVTFVIFIDTAVDAQVHATSPTTLALDSPIPNPTRGPSRMVLSLPQASEVRVTVYDVAGRLVRVLASGRLEEGARQIAWDGRDETYRPVEPGTYLIRATVAGKELVQKLTIVN
jgi:hypothetical protein